MESGPNVVAWALPGTAGFDVDEASQFTVSCPLVTVLVRSSCPGRMAVVSRLFYLSVELVGTVPF